MQSCLDTVEVVVSEATNQFSPIWKLNEEKYGILKEYCKAIDVLIKDLSADTFEINIHDIKMTISLSIGCVDLFIDQDNKTIQDLISRSITFGLKQDDDNLVITFEFPSLWDKTL